MAVNSPGRKVQLTRLTATWPPKRMVRSRVSSVKVIRASSKVCLWSIAGVAADSDVMRGLDPRIHPLPKTCYSGNEMDCRVRWREDALRAFARQWRFKHLERFPKRLNRGFP